MIREPFFRGFRWLALLIFLLHAAILSLAVDLVTAPIRYNRIIPIETGSSTAEAILLPNRVNNGPIWAFFANGVGGTIDGILVLLILFLTRREQRYIKIANATIVFIYTVSVIRALIAVIYGWSQDRSPLLVLNPSSPLNPPNPDFTIYGWTSQLVQFDVLGSDGTILNQLEELVLTLRGTGVVSVVLNTVALGLGSYRLKVIGDLLGSSRGTKQTEV